MRWARRKTVWLAVAVAAVAAVALLVTLGDGGGEQASPPREPVAAPEQFVEPSAREKIERAEREARAAEARKLKRERAQRRERRAERKRRERRAERRRRPQPLKLSLTVLDDTERRDPGRLEIVPRDGEAWKPNLNLGRDIRAMSTTARTLFIYPDGRKGKRLALRLKPPPGLDLDERQRVTITISDRTVRAIGTVIPGLERRLRRR